MASSPPPNAGGIGGRGRIATRGKIDCWNQFNKNYKKNTSILPASHTTNTPYSSGMRNRTRLASADHTQVMHIITSEAGKTTTTFDGTNDLAVNITTNPYDPPPIFPYIRAKGDMPQGRHGMTNARSFVYSNMVARNKNNALAHSHAPPLPSCPCQDQGSKGSRWSLSKAAHGFGAQSQQFDHGQCQFISYNHPTTQDIIAMTAQQPRHPPHRHQESAIAVTALQLAQAEGSAFQEVSRALEKFSNECKYGHTPHEKPSDSIRLVMENFNSLCVTSGSKKITPINNLCRDFKVDILCGCETQTDWRMVPSSRQFNKLFGMGTETRSVVAHNINECMLVNQYGGCAIMAMNTISAEVQDTKVDGTGLGRWCWIQLGSGVRKTRIVMAYQPSNSGHSSAGMTVKDQQLRYFCA